MISPRENVPPLSAIEVGVAVSKALREAVVRHAAAGYPIASLKDGKVVWLEPSEALFLMQSQGQTLPEPLRD